MLYQLSYLTLSTEVNRNGVTIPVLPATVNDLARQGVDFWQGTDLSLASVGPSRSRRGLARSGDGVAAFEVDFRGKLGTVDRVGSGDDIAG